MIFNDYNMDDLLSQVSIPQNDLLENFMFNNSPNSIEKFATNLEYDLNPFFGRERKRIKFIFEITICRYSMMICAVNAVYKNQENCKRIIDKCQLGVNHLVFNTLEKNVPNFHSLYSFRISEYFTEFRRNKDINNFHKIFMDNIELNYKKNISIESFAASNISSNYNKFIDVLYAHELVLSQCKGMEIVSKVLSLLDVEVNESFEVFMYFEIIKMTQIKYILSGISLGTTGLDLHNKYSAEMAVYFTTKSLSKKFANNNINIPLNILAEKTAETSINETRKLISKNLIELKSKKSTEAIDAIAILMRNCITGKESDLAVNEIMTMLIDLPLIKD